MARGPDPRHTACVTLHPGDALIVADVQNDFLPGGSLAVPAGDQIVPALNAYLAAFVRADLPVVATRDWHPPDHCSFQPRGGPWPPHCVAGTAGAAFHRALRLPASTIVVSKATTPEREAYSSFEGTDLDARLRALGVQRVFVGGLATDYCVRSTVKDALERGYAAVILGDAVRAIDREPGDGRRAEEEMVRLGAVLLRGEPLVG